MSWRSAWKSAVSWPVFHPAATIAVTVGICILAAIGAARLRPEPSMESMFDQRDPASRALMKVMNEFGAAEEMLLLASTPADAAPDPGRLLAFARRLEQAAAASAGLEPMCDGISYQVDPDMMRFFQEQLVPSGLYYLDEQSIAAARQRLTPESMREQIAQNESLIAAPGPAAQAIAKITLKDPLRLHEFLLERMISSRPFKTYQNSKAFLTPDGRGLLIRVRGKRAPSDIEFAKAFTAAMHELVEQVNTDGLKVDFAGSYPIATASERAIRSDMVSSVTSSMIALQVLFLLAYRRGIRLFIVAFMPVALGVLWGFGLQSLFSSSITPLTGVIGAILAGLAIDYSVHLISEFELHRRMGMNSRQAASETAMAIAPALWAAFLTTAIGFAAVAWSSLPAIRGFAILGALALVGSFACALFLLPTLMSLLDRRTLEQVQSKPLLRFRTAGLLRGVSRWRIGLLVMSLAGLAGCIVILARSPEGMLPLERDLTAMHPKPNAPLDAQAKIAERFGASPDAMIVHLEAPSPESLVTLAHQARQRVLEPQTRRSGGISATFGLAELLPDPETARKRIGMVSEREAQQVVDDFAAAINESSFDPAAYKDYQQFLKVLLRRENPPRIEDLVKYRSLAMQLLPAADVNAGRAPTQALMLVFTRTSLDVRSERSAAIESVRAALSDLRGATLTGLGVLGHDTEKVIHRDLPKLTLIAIIAVAVYLAFHFRNLGQLVLSLLPMTASLLVLLAMARLADVRLNMVNLVAAPLLIGIDVDYGIFLASLASKTLRTREAIIARLDAACHGIMVCAVSTIMGFGSLYFTSVPAIASLGFATGVGVAACLLLVMTLVTPLLLIFAKEQDSAA